ncbi:hypothetical protein FSARC_681 [Fusarium sarcochroum]|uniref:Zn(2)-C6 fungal-type domain-containing protein n=1 Tax=Fusarium sarcochroum TaxID=1208366 RepID=A0A8H4UAI7_9HYPO|nr:hypothetical protein FSARC_681 [Fusarium sarcochroum]
MTPSLRRTPNSPRHPSGPRSAVAGTPPTDLRRMLRERQLARNRKACLPCRERKVRCNHQQPCQTCIKRGHSDLCFYDQDPDLSGSHHDTTQPEIETTTGLGNDDTNETLVDNPTSHDIENSIPTPSLLGGNSIISVARSDSIQPLSDNERRTAFETGVLPLLGMDTTTDNGHVTRPGHSNSSLPDIQEMIELFSLYRDRVHPFQFVVDDLAEIEALVCSLVSRDKEARQVDNDSLCLLHAILAAGAQFSDLATAIRVSKSREKLQCALSFLGTFDLLWNPSKRLIQALLVLGHVLQNDMNPRAAWILGGTTIRLALSVGLHQSGPTPGALHLSPDRSRHLRLAIVWQDALLSLAFGRPPASQEMNIESDLPALTQPNSSGPALNYRQAMNWLCHLTLRHLQSRSETALLKDHGQIFQDFDGLESSLASHLRDQQRCASIQELQEYYSLQLHRNFVLSTFCRPILSTQFKRLCTDDEYTLILNRFRNALKQGVSAFIRLRSISSHATRSWAFVHNGLSSALLLSFIKQNPEAEDTRQIQAELIQILTERNEDIGQFSTAHKKALRAIQALQRLTEQETSGDGAMNQPDEHGPPDIVDGTTMPREPFNDSQDPRFDLCTLPVEERSLTRSLRSMLSLDDWLRTFDFDAFSPLESYNFIMSDQAPTDMSL